MSLFDNLPKIELDLQENIENKEKLKKLDKCKQNLIDARNDLADFKTIIRSYWKGADSKELIDKITELERQYTSVINTIPTLKLKIEKELDGK